MYKCLFIFSILFFLFIRAWSQVKQISDDNKIKLIGDSVIVSNKKLIEIKLFSYNSLYKPVTLTIDSLVLPGKSWPVITFQQSIYLKSHNGKYIKIPFNVPFPIEAGIHTGVLFGSFVDERGEKRKIHTAIKLISEVIDRVSIYPLMKEIRIDRTSFHAFLEMEILKLVNVGNIEKRLDIEIGSTLVKGTKRVVIPRGKTLLLKGKDILSYRKLNYLSTLPSLTISVQGGETHHYFEVFPIIAYKNAMQLKSPNDAINSLSVTYMNGRDFSQVNTAVSGRQELDDCRWIDYSLNIFRDNSWKKVVYNGGHFGYNTPRWRVEIGNVSTVGRYGVGANGIKISHYLDSGQTLFASYHNDILLTRNVSNYLFSSAQIGYRVKRSAWEYETGLTYRSKADNLYEAKIWSNGLNYFGKAGNLQVQAGISEERIRKDEFVPQVKNYGGSMQLNYSFNNLKWSINSYNEWASNCFSDYNRGNSRFSANVSRKIYGKNIESIGVKFSQSNTRPVDQFIYPGRTIMQYLQNVAFYTDLRLKNRIGIGLSAGMIDQGYNIGIITSDGVTNKGYYLQTAGRYFVDGFSCEVLAHSFLDRERHAKNRFRLGTSIEWKNFRTGYEFNNTLMTDVYEGGQFVVGGNWNRQLLNLSYNYPIFPELYVGVSGRFIKQHDLMQSRWYTGRINSTWRVATGLKVDYSFSCFNSKSTGGWERNYTHQAGAIKTFGSNLLRKHKKEILFFEDGNGNGVKDEGEVVVKDVLITAKHAAQSVLLRSDGAGKVVLNNYDPTSHVVKVKDGGDFDTHFSDISLLIAKDKKAEKVFVPMYRKKKISGIIRFHASANVELTELPLLNILILIDNGLEISTISDVNGRYQCNIPKNTGKFTISIDKQYIPAGFEIMDGTCIVDNDESSFQHISSPLIIKHKTRNATIINFTSEADAAAR